MNDRDRLEEDCRILIYSRCGVKSTTRGVHGYMILWFNHWGYTVAVVRYSPYSCSIGKALRYEEALAEYKSRIDEII